MSAKQPISSLNILEAFLGSNPSVRLIRLTFVRYGNMHITNLITLSRALEMAQDDRAGFSVNPANLYRGSAIGGSIREFIREADDYAVPDWSTICLFGGRSGQASVLCRVRETSEPAEKQYIRDPPSILQRVEDEAKDDGYTFKVGFEIEFLLLPIADIESNNPEPKIVGLGSSLTSGLLRPSSLVVEESMLALESSGIAVWGGHQEDARDHYEIAIGHASPSKAVNRLVNATDIIKAIAAKHGWHATMHPRPFEYGPASGQHINISIQNDHGDLPEPMLDHVIASLLDDMRPLRAFLGAGYDSYGCCDEYLGRGIVFWSKWKDAPVHRTENRFECRVPDALGNPYLQLATIIGLALKGLLTKPPLSMKPVHHIGSPLPRELWSESGVTELLPRDLAESIAALKAVDARQIFEEILGKECVAVYIRSKEEEIRIAEGMTFAERRKKTIANI